MNVTLQGDDVQGFGAKWDEVLPSTRGMPGENSLEGIDKTKLCPVPSRYSAKRVNQQATLV